nr:PREDICTED: pyridoxal phosphate phosphatase PHOSPHO2-like [Bemisia tabaci]
MKLLIAFDFDHTVVDANTDIVVRKLVHDSKIPDSTREISKKHGWTAYMREIFKILRRNDVTPKKIVESVQKIPPVSGMVELFKFLKCNNCDVIIISDSNSVFISDWLKHYGLSDHVSAVFTNPAYFDESNLLHIEMYHEQHSCKLSAINLCKGAILEQYISDQSDKGVSFDVIAFVGDGKNDLCPSLRLKEKDLIFAREGYVLKDILTKPESDHKASLHSWSTAYDIKKVLSSQVFHNTDLM